MISQVASLRFVLVIAAAAALIPATYASAGQIEQIAPAVVERGNVVTLIGRGFGDRFGNDVVIFRIVNGAMQEDIYPAQVTLWSDMRIKAVVPEHIPPADAFGIFIRGVGGQEQSNWMPLTVRQATLPRWSLRPGEAMANRCDARRARGNGQYPPCPAFSRITGLDPSRAFPGGRLLIAGDFSGMSQTQLVALVRADFLYTEEIGQSVSRDFVRHVLPMIRWTDTEIELALGNDVFAGPYRVVIVSPLPELGGIFEKESNSVPLVVQGAWR